MNQKKQIENIRQLKATNHSYAEIAKILSIPINSVKSICRRNGFTVDPEHQNRAKEKTAAPVQEQLIVCEYCGKLMNNLWHRKGKRFCSDRCRYDYWNREKRLTHYISPKRRK